MEGKEARREKFFMGLRERIFHSTCREKNKEGNRESMNLKKRRKRNTMLETQSVNRWGGGTVHEEISALLTKRSLFSLCQNRRPGSGPILV